MTFVVVKLTPSSSEESLSLCVIVTVDLVVEITLRSLRAVLKSAQLQTQNVPYVMAAAFSKRALKRGHFWWGL